MRKTIIAIMLLLSPILFGQISASAAVPASAPAIKKDRISPALLIEIDRYNSGKAVDTEHALLIRTKNETTKDQRALVEKSGGVISNVSGGILAVKARTRDLATISNLDFIMYIDKMNKPHKK